MWKYKELKLRHSRPPATAPTPMAFTFNRTVSPSSTPSLQPAMIVFQLALEPPIYGLRMSSVALDMESGFRVTAPGDSHNTDGIHVQSDSVTILNSIIATSDDCVSIGPGTTNLWIENVICGPGHGISVGSLGKKLQEAGVENVSGVQISDVTYKDIHGTSASEVAVKFV
ncbi:hypothetical protein EZV62_001563 [Acer yangbiense]|uniref:Pectate lyase superfamily protein domain-containing protein n=1 Tax=Acer yangbiense TaxID=1000413 RepID=A0A5C7IVT4_9ROSI|nr:hypothetical protein EZV62_001563 [Acer yangbiense]